MMKSRILSLFLALILVASLAFPVCALEIALIEDGNSVYDEANLLTSAEEEEVAEMLDDIGAKYETHAIIVTVSELDSDPDDFVENLYDTMDFGYGENRDGILLLVCMDPREYRILANGYAADAMDDDAIAYIGDAVATYLSDGDYKYAFLTFAQECEYYLNGDNTGTAVNAPGSTDSDYADRSNFSPASALLSSLVMGVVIGLVVVAILAGQLKSVKKQNQARDYMKPGSMRLTLSNDIFLYRNVSRTRKESSSSSSGSRSRSSSSSRSRSSSRRVGGGKF